MVVRVLKHTFQRSAPKELVYKDYNNFDRVIFKRELEDKLNQQIKEYKYFTQIFLEILNIYKYFTQIFLEILNIYAPIKKKLLRANHVAHMTKALRKAVMKSSELKSTYIKNMTSQNLKPYKKQGNFLKNFCNRLYYTLNTFLF